MRQEVLTGNIEEGAMGKVVLIIRRSCLISRDGWVDGWVDGWTPTDGLVEGPLALGKGCERRKRLLGCWFSVQRLHGGGVGRRVLERDGQDLSRIG